MECDNKEVYAHHHVDFAAPLLRVKYRVGSWYERAKGATSIASIDMKTALFNSLGDDTYVRIEIWKSTTQTTLKLCHQLGAVTGLLERELTAGIGMSRTIKNELNNVQEEFEAALKARKKSLAKHMWMIWDRYVGKILDTRFEVTKSILNFESFDMEIDINLHVMEVVASFSFDGETHDKIGTKRM